MLHKYKLVIFDWDGTLINSSAHIVKCMQQAAQDHNEYIHNDEDIRQTIGLSLPNVLATLFPSASPQKVADIHQSYSKYFFQNVSPLFSGALATLEELKQAGIKIAIATGKSRRGLDWDLQQLGIQSYFDTTRCASETSSKPNPQMALEILEELDIKPSEAVMVGDTTFDIQMASNANFDSIAVTYGVHKKEQFAAFHPTAYLEEISQLSSLVIHQN